MPGSGGFCLYLFSFCDFDTKIEEGEQLEAETTMCPKVAEKSNVPCFSAICAWILKPFDLQIAMMVRFVMMYDIP